jgi:hypothetical protein
MPATMTAYRLTSAPKFAGLRTHDCTRCGRTEVRPVWLADGPTGAPMAYGSGCAAVMLGRPREAARKVVDEAAALQRQADAAEAARLERAESAGRALELFDTRGDGPDLERWRRNFWHAKRAAGTVDDGELLRPFLVRAAATGEL